VIAFFASVLFLWYNTLENNSPEAKDFLNIAKTFTFFTTDAWRNKYSNSEFVARNLLQAVQNNIISNPQYMHTNC